MANDYAVCALPPFLLRATTMVASNMFSVVVTDNVLESRWHKI